MDVSVYAPRYHAIYKYASQFYHYLLLNHDCAKDARAYLENRGYAVTDPIIAEFQLGFSPDTWQTLLTFLRNKGFSGHEIAYAGLANKSDKNNRLYDVFRGRIMFPLRTLIGDTVGFSGRLITAEKTAKYINTHETLLFHKREILFGIDHAKDAIQETKSAILVEGEMDMLSSYRMGVKNVVAVKGSVLTEEQITALASLASTLYLCFDADFAGDKASRTAIELAQQHGLNVFVIQVLQGKDPDECIRIDPQLWRDSVTQAVPYMDFLINTYIKQGVTGSIFEKSRIVNEVCELLLRVQDSVQRDTYINRLAFGLGVGQSAIYETLEKRVKIQRYSKGA